MTHTKPITLPAALNWVVGEIARLDEEREQIRLRMVQDAADIDAIDLLRDELDRLRRSC